MSNLKILKGKKILVVDDEPDVLEVVEEALFDSDVHTAADFESAREVIESQRFDLVILDIMGVNGFQLLEVCGSKGLPAAMMTARSTDIPSLNRSLRLGAVSFLPKEEISSLRELTAEILEGLEEGKSHWARLFSRLGPLFKERFGIVWQDLEKPTHPRIPWD